MGQVQAAELPKDVAERIERNKNNAIQNPDDTIHAGYVERWNRIREGGDPKDFWDNLVVGSQNTIGEIGNFFDPNVTTLQETLQQKKLDAEKKNELSSRAVRMNFANDAREFAGGISTQGMFKYQENKEKVPNDTTLILNQYVRVVGDK